MTIANGGGKRHRERPVLLVRIHGCALPALLPVLLLSGCHHSAKVARRSPPPASRAPATTAARRVPALPIPYTPADDNAVPPARTASTEIGLASWYGPPYANRPGANGQIYDANAMTAAHRTLPMGTVLRVTNLSTSQAATVTITDRGPFIHGRVLDLSLGAAKATGVYRMGVAEVRIEVLEPGANAGLAGKWCVQVGAFLDAGNASRLQADLQRRYITTARVVRFQGPTGYWVRVNPQGGNRAQATAIAAAIRTTEPDALPYLVRLD